ESRTCLGKGTSVLPRLRMYQNDRLSDSIEQGRKIVNIHLRLSFAVIHRGNVGGNVIVEGGITRLRLARPLRMEFCLRPKIVFFACRESLHRAFASLGPRLTVDIGDVSRAGGAATATTEARTAGPRK